MIKRLYCKYCGKAVISPTLRCGYCGTVYQKAPAVNEECYIVTVPPQVDVLNKSLFIDTEYIKQTNSDKLAEFAVDMTMKQLTEALLPYVDTKWIDIPKTRQKQLKVTLRMIRPDFEF